ncbi:MAG TPA: TerC family protein [Thermomicrobiales bacterium]|nr:TerC family protein [Thermomicrobiales bacterium]
MSVPMWVWAATVIGVAALLIFDFYSHVKTPHEPTLKEAGIWSTVYIAGALVFGAGLWWVWGSDHGLEYFAGFLTEKSLSVDNLFVFLLIMSTFAVPRQYQQKVLLIGVAIAIVMRGVFIALGAAIIENFSWIFYIFGIFLLYTGWKLMESPEEAEEEYEENAFIRLMRRIWPVTDGYVEDKMFLVRHGRRMITPMAIVMLAIGSTDLLFAFDSIPAIFGLTQEPYIVFTANAWALLGLRQLYFLLGGLLERLVYLAYGLAFILIWIGIKLIIHALHENEVPFINDGEHVTIIPEIPTWLSLIVITLTIALAAIFSIRKTNREKPDVNAALDIPSEGD